MAEAVAVERRTRIAQVPPAGIEPLRGQLTVLLEDAMARDHRIEAPDDVLGQAADGRAQIWLACDDERRLLGMVATAVIQHPAARVLRITYTAGWEMAAWLEAMHRVLAAYAKDRGCVALEYAVGGGDGGPGPRRGWERALRRFGGYEYTRVFRVDVPA